MSILKSEQIIIIEKTIELSKKYIEIHNKYKSKNKKPLSTKEILERKINPEEVIAKENLIKYLSSQTFENLKVILTVMYIGREYEGEVHDGEELYNNMYARLIRENQKKEDLVKWIKSKFPLADYLFNGLRILKH